MAKLAVFETTLICRSRGANKNSATSSTGALAGLPFGRWTRRSGTRCYARHCGRRTDLSSELSSLGTSEIVGQTSGTSHPVVSRFFGRTIPPMRHTITVRSKRDRLIPKNRLPLNRFEFCSRTIHYTIVSK